MKPTPSKDPVAHLLTVIGLVGVVCYVGGIVYAGLADPKTDANHANVMGVVNPLVTVIGATLATNFGAVVGIRTAAANLTSNGNGIARLQSDRPLQVVAAWVYFISLVVAIVLWGIKGFSPGAAEVIRNMALTLPGIIGGTVAVMLNTQAPQGQVLDPPAPNPAPTPNPPPSDV